MSPKLLYRLSLAISFWLSLSALSAQLTLQISQLPTNTPENSTIYASGDFNNWSPDDLDYIFQPNNTGTLSLTLPNLSPGDYAFKLTRGSWPTVEGNVNGGFRPNREFTYNDEPTTLTLDVLSWEDLGGTNSTAANNVQILSDNFSIPQLGRERRIWLYLPPDYETSNRTYPVLYMHDGQNLFDAANSFSGEWEVDETLNALFASGDPGIIVVGIDNGQGNRLAEYTPWANAQYGGGEGDSYVDFLVETLKPYIDANYRTRPEANYTGIMGSSLGGLISLYAALRHPEVFGKAGVLSPSLWFTEDIYRYVDTVAQSSNLRMYFVAGGSESNTINVIEDVNRFVDRMEAVNYPAVSERAFHAEGQHAEWYWAREFGAAYQWLFRDLTVLDQHNALAQLVVFPNPVMDTLYIKEGATTSSDWNIHVFNVNGQLQPNLRWTGNSLDVSSLKSGIYFAMVKNGEEQWALLRFIKQ